MLTCDPVRAELAREIEAGRTTPTEAMKLVIETAGRCR